MSRAVDAGRRPPTKPAALSCAVCMLLAVTAGFASAEGRAGFRMEPDAVVVRYVEILPELAPGTARRELVVFGDGRVLRREPALRTDAGEWEMQLDAGELRSLVRSLVDDGVSRVQPGRLQSKLRERSARARRRHRAHDASTIQIELNLTRGAALGASSPGPAAGPRSGLVDPASVETSRIEWRALRATVRQHPEDAELAGIARACRRLEDLMGHREFRRKGAR